jgi:hypothetical protein
MHSSRDNTALMRAFAPSNAVHDMKCTLDLALTSLATVRKQASLADKMSCNTAIWTSNTMVYCATEIEYMKKAWDWTSQAFESSTAYSTYASNTASWSSNVAAWKSNNSAQIVELIRWASNAACFGSNASSWASNQIAVGGSHRSLPSFADVSLGTSGAAATHRALHKDALAGPLPAAMDNSTWLFDMATYGSNLAADAFNAANWASNVMGESGTNWDYVIGTVDWASNACDALGHVMYPVILSASNAQIKMEWASNCLVDVEARGILAQASLSRLLALSNDMARLSNASGGMQSNIAQLATDHETVRWMSNWMSYMITMDTLSNMSHWTSNYIDTMLDNTEWTSNTLGALESLSNLDHLHYASNLAAWTSNQFPQFALKVDERHWQYGLQTAVWSSNALAGALMPADIEPMSNAIHDLTALVMHQYPDWDYASNASLSNAAALEALFVELTSFAAYASNNFSNYAPSSVRDAVDDVIVRAISAQAQADDCIPRTREGDIVFASNMTVSLSKDVSVLESRIQPSAWDYRGAVFTACNVEIATTSPLPLAVRVVHKDINNQPKHSVAIYTSEGIVSKDMHVVADVRMRASVSDVDCARALAAIRSMRPARISYVGTQGDGKDDNTVVGFVSSKVEAAAPHAVSTITDFVPNIYSMATAVSPTTLVLDTGKTTALIRDDLPMRLRIVVLSGAEKDVEREQQVLEVNVTSILDTKRMKIDVPLTASRCFVYGQRVSNVKTIDPNQILALNVAATAYIDESLQQSIADTVRMKGVIKDQQTQIEALQMRLDKMDDIVKSILI